MTMQLIEGATGPEMEAERLGLWGKTSRSDDMADILTAVGSEADGQP
jgi:hypothetical protein